jgi:hypothetical protein
VLSRDMCRMFVADDMAQVRGYAAGVMVPW